MEILPQKNIEEYEHLQIERSRAKFNFCKVSFADTVRWKNIIERDLKTKILDSKICCLGTRSGKEVDLFRIAFSYNYIVYIFLNIISISKILEKIFMNFLLTIGRKKISFKSNKYCYGVEINPDARRKDILISNFDLISSSWDSQFNIIFSNSIDQSMDPVNTSEKWHKLLVKSDTNSYSYLIICFSYTAPELTDPTGYVTLDDIKDLFPGEVIYYSKSISTYQEVIIKAAKH